jgi:hypothetical protein
MDIHDRLTRFEWRLDELTNDLQSRTITSPAAAPALDQTPELARQVLYFGERLAGLEAAFQERSFRQFDEPLATANIDDREHEHLVEVLSGTITRLAARVEQIGRDVQRLQAEASAPAPESVAPAVRLVSETGTTHADEDLRKDVASLKASVETLILAISMGLGRAAA